MIYELYFDSDTLDEYTQHYFALHPKAKNVPIKHPYHPSVNEWMIMKRPAMNGLKQKWKDFIIWLVERHGYSNLLIDRCEIDVWTYYYTNRRHDPDNSVIKFILDGMCSSKMLEDDDDRHVHALTLRCRVDVNHPHTVIVVREVDHDADNYVDYKERYYE